MINFDTLRTSVTSAIRPNDNQEIQGQTLQNILLAMITAFEDAANTSDMDVHAISESEYNALSDKSGIHFVYPD